MQVRVNFILFCLLSVLVCGCTSDEHVPPGRTACAELQRSATLENARIIDGSPCPVQGSPVAQLTILLENGDVSICSGTVVHARYVLTAAHCYLETAEGPVIDSSVRIEGFDYPVQNVFIHPEANLPQNDVAIVRLARKVSIAPVPLLTSAPVEPERTISIFGYGFDENNNFANLRSGEMEVTGITSQNIFARFLGSDSNVCFGDSGGPALTKGDDGQLGIVGVTSFATSEGCVDDSFAAFANLQGKEIQRFVFDIIPDIETN